MTELDMAIRWASEFRETGALRLAVRDRLLGRAVGGLAFGKTDEHPEDVIVGLLRSADAGEARLGEVAAGWKAARRCVGSLLEGLTCEGIPGELADAAFARVFRVAELTGDARLRDGVFSDLRLAISGTDVSGVYVQQVVAAALAYEPTERDYSLWEPALANEDVAAYAFQALLQIPSARKQISAFLEKLVRRQYVDGWDISVWFIAEFARTALGSDASVIEALRRIRKRDPGLWRKIKQDAPQDACWSDAWVPKVEKPEVWAASHSALATKVRPAESTELISYSPILSYSPSTMEKIHVVGSIEAFVSVRQETYRVVFSRATYGLAEEAIQPLEQMRAKLLQQIKPSFDSWFRSTLIATKEIKHA